MDEELIHPRDYIVVIRLWTTNERVKVIQLRHGNKQLKKYGFFALRMKVGNEQEIPLLNPQTISTKLFRLHLQLQIVNDPFPKT